jgi:hypothetical protein
MTQRFHFIFVTPAEAGAQTENGFPVAQYCSHTNLSGLGSRRCGNDGLKKRARV